MHKRSIISELCAIIAIAGLGIIRRLILQEIRNYRASEQAKNPSMPPPSAYLVPFGTRMELHGLKAKPQLNEQFWIVVSYMKSSGQCTVVFKDAGGRTKKKMNTKPKNLNVKRK